VNERTSLIARPKRLIMINHGGPGRLEAEIGFFAALDAVPPAGPW
jgi:hypothetical protein